MERVLPAEVPSTNPAPARVRHGLGLIGLVIAMLGLAMAIARPHIVEGLKPPEPLPQKLSEKLAEAGDKFVGRMIDRVKGRKAEVVPVEPTAMSILWDRYLRVAATSLGFVGVVLGTVGWIRREDPRMAAVAIVAGSLAVAWFYIVTALAMALVILVLLLLMSLLGGLPW